MSLSILSALKWWALEDPDRLAISVADQQATFGELRHWAGKVSRALSELGIQKGDRVGIMAANSLDYCTVMLGAIAAGAIAVPLNFRLTAAELKIAIEETSPKLIIADAERMAVAQSQVAGFEDLHLQPLDSVRVWREGEGKPVYVEAVPDDAVSIIFTSGSTARPKGVLYTHGSIAVYAGEFALQEPGCARDGRAIIFAPFSSASGTLLFLEFLVMGATSFIESGFDPARALKLLVEEGINNLQGAPIFFERISQEPGFKEADFSKLRYAQVGGARVSKELLDAWRGKGVILRQLYGQTEAGGGWAARNTAVTEPDKCGRGGIFTEFAILADGEVWRANKTGEILVRGPAVMKGYWNKPDATHDTFHDGWLKTGDLGVLDEEGNLTFVDRLKDIIISGGLNIAAAEVEHVIGELEGIIEVAVIAAPDPKFGETPMAIIYGPNAPTADQIVKWCDKHLSNYKVPRFVVIETEPLPRVASGKISKPQLRERYRSASLELPRVR